MNSLHDRLVARIDESGSISFADFVEAALYDPEHGFYAEPPVGPAGHFVTSPHICPVFARLIARQIDSAWQAAGSPVEFVIIDAGAGDGTLLAQLRDELPASLRGVARLIGVERMEAGRRSIAAAGFEVVGALDELDTGSAGFVIANELLDNLPFHRLRAAPDGAVFEVRVGRDDGRFVEVLVPAGPDLTAARPHPEPGYECIISPHIEETLRQIDRVLGRGQALIIDYEAGEGWMPVRAYALHQADVDPLASPGSRDVTAGVDFGSLVRLAAAVGFEPGDPITQRELLSSLGYAGEMQRLRQEQSRLEGEGRWRDALRLFAQRQAASVLIDPSRLGNLRAIVLTKLASDR